MLLSLLLAAAALAGDMVVDMLDVGQGDSILIRSPEGRAVLIDGGTGRYSPVPMLVHEGVSRLDLVVATHPHADHIGGLDEVLEAFEVKNYTDNGLPHTTATYTGLMSLVESHQIRYRGAVVGQVYNLDDGIRLEVVNPSETPLKDTRSDLNSNSVVLRVTHGKDCILLTGDSEDPTEQAMMQRGVEPCEVLKVAHHGSGHSTSDAWLRAVQPKIALISVGADNRYHHPYPECLDRLTSAGATIYRTDLLGSIRAISSGHGWRIESGVIPRGDPTEPGFKPRHFETVPAVPVGAVVARGPRDAVQSSPTSTSLTAGDLSAADPMVEAQPDPRGISGDKDPNPRSGRKGGRRGGKRAPADPAKQGSTPPEAVARAEAPAPIVPPTTNASGIGPFDLNAVSPAQLMLVPGIGPSKAAAIVGWREGHGPFGRLEDLDAVPGIGPATIASLRPFLFIKPTTAGSQ